MLNYQRVHLVNLVCKQMCSGADPLKHLKPDFMVHDVDEYEDWLPSWPVDIDHCHYQTISIHPTEVPQ